MSASLEQKVIDLARALGKDLANALLEVVISSTQGAQETIKASQLKSDKPVAKPEPVENKPVENKPVENKPVENKPEEKAEQSKEKPPKQPTRAEAEEFLLKILNTKGREAAKQTLAKLNLTRLSDIEDDDVEKFGLFIEEAKKVL